MIGTHGSSPPPRRVQLTDEGIAAVTAVAGALTGLSTRGARLLKFTNNAVVLLPAAGAVLRVAGSAEARTRVPVVVAVARWLAALRLPAVRLFPGLDQPLDVGGHAVTVWRAVDTGAGPATAAGLAGFVRALHDVAVPPPPELPRWNQAGFIRHRLGEAAGVCRDDLDFLHAELEVVEGLLAGLRDVDPLVPPGVLHGDVFLGNVIPSPAGPVVCDFDGFSVGPREWDLVPVAVGALRFDYAAGLQEEFARAYGVDVTRWEGFPALRRLRELQLVTSVLPVLEANPALRPQWRVRLDSLRSGDTRVRWSPYPSATPAAPALAARPAGPLKARSAHASPR